MSFDIARKNMVILDDAGYERRLQSVHLAISNDEFGNRVLEDWQLPKHEFEVARKYGIVRQGSIEKIHQKAEDNPYFLAIMSRQKEKVLSTPCFSRYHYVGANRRRHKVMERLKAKPYQGGGQMVTLTFDRKCLSWQDSWRKVGKAMSGFMNSLRMAVRRKQIESRFTYDIQESGLVYAWVLEAQADGFAHAHLLLPDCIFIDWKYLHSAWKYGMLQAEKFPESASKYIAKYAGKCSQLPLEIQAVLRFYKRRCYQTSRNFAPKGERKAGDWVVLDKGRSIAEIRSMWKYCQKRLAEDRYSLEEVFPCVSRLEGRQADSEDLWVRILFAVAHGYRLQEVKYGQVPRIQFEVFRGRKKTKLRKW